MPLKTAKQNIEKHSSRPTSLVRSVSLCLVLLIAVPGFAWSPSRTKVQEIQDKLPEVIGNIPSDVEGGLVKALLALRNNRVDIALKEIDAILEKKPNFRLGHLIKGDLLMARYRPISTIGNVPDAQPRTIADLREEARVRLERYLDAPPAENRTPKYLMQLAPSQKHAVLVDASRSRLYLFSNDNGKPKYLTDYYISIGLNGFDKEREGDQRTPIGVYHVTASLPKKTLSDFYGDAAFPLNYPNDWDKLEGRDGYGIWLHGTPSDTYSRPPRASNGCVVLTNQDLTNLSKFVQIGATPVVITDRVEWMENSDWEDERDSFRKSFNRWKKDWEGLDVDKYLSHYSPNFVSEGKKFNAWASQKRQVINGKTWVKVGVNNMSLFGYPGVKDMIVVNYDQEYGSNNLSTQARKRQYWVKENSDWKIIYEGSA
ncbi:MAG: L,D-transpeptidase family protein [Burkholderiales bacterium]